MSMSNKQIVQEFYNRLNEQSVEKIWEYIDDNFEYALETWIERGVYLKTEGKKAIVREVSPDAPGAEKIQLGDEVVRVQEAGHVYETFEEIRYDAWGLNPKEKFNIRVRRDGELFDYDITPVVAKMGRMPFPLEQLKKNNEANKDTNPELHYELEYLIAEGDLVASITSCTGMDKKYKRPLAYSQALVFQFADGKIVRMFELHNVAAELRQQGYRFIPPDE
jgi:ketosteroid isomerase-like protein